MEPEYAISIAHSLNGIEWSLYALVFLVTAGILYLGSKL